MKINPAKMPARVLLVCLLHPALSVLGAGSIQTLVDAASDGQTLEIPAGTYFENVVITKSLTLRSTNATGTVVDGGTLGSVLIIRSNLTVTLDGLTIVNGLNRGADGTPQSAAGDARGGGIQNEGSSLTVVNCTFSNNVAQGGSGTDGNKGGDASGGAIWHGGGALTLSNCLVTGNRVLGGVGAPQIMFVLGAGRGGSAFGGGICKNGGSMVVTDCIFTNNGATGGPSGPLSSGSPRGDDLGGDGFGGAIFQSDDTALLVRTVLCNNTVSGGSGAASSSILIIASDGKGFGAGIAAIGGTVTLAECNLLNNDAVGLPHAKGGGTYGGGIYQGAGTLNLTSTTFATNTAIGGFAGYADERGTLWPEAEDALGGAIFNAGDVNITNCVFLGNATLGGASDAVSSHSHSLGGAIFNEGTIAVFASTLAGNAAVGGEGLIDWNHGYPVPGGPGYGGAICSFSKLIVAHCVFSTNVAKGGIGDAAHDEDSADGRGGAIYSSGSCFTSDCTFVGNIAVGGAGQPPGGTWPGDGGDGEGSGIFSVGELFAERNTFEMHRAIGGNAPLTSSSSMSHGFAGTARGGGICSLGSSFGTNNTFYANSASGGASRTVLPGGDALGGGVFGPATLDHCTLAENRADGGVGTNGLAGSAFGGAVCTTNGVLTLRNSILAGSPSGGNGSGAILDAGYNLSTDSSCSLTNVGSRPLTDPLLGPLADHGGPTRTMALLPGSPAIDAGTSLDGPGVDQRGVARPHDVLGILNVADGADIGAFEYEGTSWCRYLLSSTDATFDPGGGTGTLTVTVDEARGEWAVINADAWISSINPSRGVGSGSLTYTLAPNCGLSRTGTLAIADQVLSVTQSGDTVPPQIICPPNLVVGADHGQTSKSHVTFTASALDNCDTNLDVVCVPPAGATFPQGVTLVTCSATDSAGNRTTCAFAVTVNPSNAPPVCELRVPCAWTAGDIAYAIALDGIAACVVLDGSGSHDPDTPALQLTWMVDGTNVFGGAVWNLCLAAGCHSVALTASDGQAESRCERMLCVITAGEAVEQCIALVDAAALARKNKRPLLASLKAAIGAFDRGDQTAGLNQLHAVQEKARVQLARSNPTAAATLLDRLRQIVETIHCASLPAGEGVTR